MTDSISSGADITRIVGMRSDRFAVSAMFLANGFMVGSWAPKIPELAQRLALSESVLGMLIVLFGVGSLIFMPIAGGLIARHGSSIMTRILAAALLPMLLFVTLAPNVWVVGVLLLFFGAFVGGMDVAMNANAVTVERRMRSAIMSSCHGFWSVGGLIGAAAGGVAIELIGALGHAVLLTIAGALVVVLAWPHVSSDAPSTSSSGAHHQRGFPKSPLPYLLGLMALFAMIPEGSVLDWGALYLRQELGADVALSGFAFGAFSATMAVMRFAGDAIRQRLGAVMTLRLCALVAMSGLVAVSFASSPYVAVAGFALAGIGISNLVPIAFSAAGNVPGVPTGISMSIVTVMGYSGILLAPSVIGFIAEHTGFAPIYAALALLLVVVLAFSPIARHGNFRQQD